MEPRNQALDGAFFAGKSLILPNIPMKLSEIEFLIISVGTFRNFKHRFMAAL
jgi:hypothetical protein